jgi:hypothetical protein
MQLIDIIPITYTKYPSSKRPNRINRQQGLTIERLYREKDISEISSIINKSETAITKYLTNKKLL